ncbi:unnamed protein product [Scytosiphon promiscuus]
MKGTLGGFISICCLGSESFNFPSRGIDTAVAVLPRDNGPTCSVDTNIFFAPATQSNATHHLTRCHQTAQRIAASFLGT